MKEYLALDQKKRLGIAEIIKETLSARNDVAFTFLYGSFLDAPSFRDIDIGAYLKHVSENEVFDIEVKLDEAISKAVGIPLDIVETRVLNFANKSFLNNIFSRGRLLFSKDDRLLADLVEDTSLETIANEHIARQSLKELLPA